MSYTTPRLRKRKPIFNKETEEKIGSYRRDLLNQHDTFTMAYVGISLLASIFNVGQVLIPLLFLSDVVWMEYGNEYTSKTQMKKCYQINLICTSCLALASGFDKMDYPFKIHMLITIIPIFFISHRRNPKNTFLELLWVLGWSAGGRCMLKNFVEDSAVWRLFSHHTLRLLAVQLFSHGFRHIEGRLWKRAKDRNQFDSFSTCRVR